jgi:AraC family transcriptional regulator, regulatory protein of adaptative response / methylated-DNA-[protein]-cysteine methyltransferase
MHATMIHNEPAMAEDEQAYWEATFWEALERRDAGMDGVFYYAVISTGVYCRPSCPSRHPRRDRVIFFQRRAAAERAGFRPCLRCKPERPRVRDAQSELVEKICRHLEGHLEEPVTLAGLSRQLGLSPFHLQRKFKAATGITPRGYADFCRLASFKGGLRAGRPVTTALYEAGYGSSSRLYERAASQLGMTPTAYRRGGRGAAIRFEVLDTPAGLLLVGATEKGICSIKLGDSEAELERALRQEFPAAEVRRDAEFLSPWAGALREHLAGRLPKLEVPVDIQATAFQRRVWEYLQSIPYGTTQSYGQIARALGQPTASRAVARACATNPVAVVIPCHRVVRGDGAMGGYRWGTARKRKLLEMEVDGGVVTARSGARGARQ